MTMYRQLLLAIISSTLLALFCSLLAATLSARTYLTEQLTLKNSDNAAALALSLSQQPDPVAIELAVAALFDSGHYEAIRVSDPRGRPIAERVDNETIQDAPRWFTHLLPIDAEPGRAQISDGWKQFGQIEVISNSRFAYRSLWQSIWKMVSSLTLAGLIACYLGHRILLRLQRPLQTVIRQAQAITERRFITIEEPDVPELKQLAGAMNATVERLKLIFEEEAARLEAVRKEANFDALTNLANRSYFMSRLRDALHREDASGGVVILLRLTQLAGINQGLGRDATDTMLAQIGQLLNEKAQLHSGSLPARLNGADFALLLPSLSSDKSQTFAQELLDALSHLGAAYVSSGNFACMGLTAFEPHMEMGTLLSLTDSTLASAEATGENALRIASTGTSNNQPRNADEWESTITTALSQGWVRLISFPMADFNGQHIHDECPLRLMFDASGEWQPAGRFMPVAERLRLTPQIDLAAVKLGLDALQQNAALPGLAINLSSNSISDTTFRNALREALKRNPAASKRLWLEIPESGAFDQIEHCRTLCAELKPFGCRLGVEHFGRQFSRIGQLQELGLDYLKVDSSFVRGIDFNTGNQAFLKGLSSIAHNMGLVVYAEGVTSQGELKALAELGFDGATGPVVKIN